MSSGTANYNLTLAFDTDDPEFCRGVEVGTIWVELHHFIILGSKAPGVVMATTAHENNVEMVHRMAKAKGLTARVKHLPESPGWINVMFERLPS